MTRGSSKAMSLDDFLGHKSRQQGGGASFVKSWKKEGHLELVLHTRAPIVAIWQSAWPKIEERERDGSTTLEVWSGRFNSWEAEDVLKQQYFLDDDGDRKVPPQICPMAIMIDRVRCAVRDGEVPWYTPLFRFDASDPNKSLVLHAAGVYNGIAKIRKALSEQADQVDDNDEPTKAAKAAKAELQEAKRHAVPSSKDAWRQNLMPKCNYIFTVALPAKVEDGIGVTTETTAVGDATKEVIRDRMTAFEDPDDPSAAMKGNPMVRPYIIKWTYDKDAKMDAKYKAVALERDVPEKVLHLVTETDPPNIDSLTKPGDIKALRTSMEEHYIGPDGLLDWDEIFGPAEHADAEPDSSSGDEEREHDAGDDEVEEPKKAAAKKSTAKKSTAKKVEPVDPYAVAKTATDDEGEKHWYAADGVELFGCDGCGEVVRDDDTKCRKCGKVFEAEEESEPEPEPEPEPAPRPRTRGKGESASTRAKKSGRDRVNF